MSIKELVDQSVPFASVLFHGSAIPEVLVKLAICKAGELCIKVAYKVKDEEEVYEVHH